MVPFERCLIFIGVLLFIGIYCSIALFPDLRSLLDYFAVSSGILEKKSILPQYLRPFLFITFDSSLKKKIFPIKVYILLRGTFLYRNYFRAGDFQSQSSLAWSESIKNGDQERRQTWWSLSCFDGIFIHDGVVFISKNQHCKVGVQSFQSRPSDSIMGHVQLSLRSVVFQLFFRPTRND